ncbi:MULTISPECIES: hypothetical protein [unclassified Roseofilum]|uniref:hypothetical protein n=1 Tax=unclassified Roseofilum TaxID=2620099 RepID=UPI001B2B9A40|nr:MULTISPECIES: hypothetical protein [unclassified Roseofilum]MBP0011020.1 hypothetical protein [Roseofilum sp. Belize Diploria]MBP0035692.1 hypothetical protein [Roseofilum sp. Belize BBD 4]
MIDGVDRIQRVWENGAIAFIANQHSFSPNVTHSPLILTPIARRHKQLKLTYQSDRNQR